jgi:small subunit ribosomal protein S16
MAVKIRLQRVGANNQPKYRMVVAEDSTKRDGRFVELLGNYDPTNKVEGKQLTINLERAAYWTGVGAQPSDTARTLINRAKREAAGKQAAAAPAKA